MTIYIFGDDWKPLLYLAPFTKAYKDAIMNKSRKWQQKFSNQPIRGKDIKEYIMTSGTFILLREEEALCEL